MGSDKKACSDAIHAGKGEESWGLVVFERHWHVHPTLLMFGMTVHWPLSSISSLCCYGVLLLREDATLDSAGVVPMPSSAYNVQM